MIIRRLFLIILSICSSCLLVTTAQAQPNPPLQNDGKVTLKLKPHEGQTYKLILITKNKTSQAMMGQNNDVRQTLSMELDYQVVKVDDAGLVTMNLTLHPRWQSFQMGNGETLDFDFTKPAPAKENPMAGMMRKMEGITLTIVSGPDGGTKSIGGMDELWNRMTKDIPAAARMGKMMKEHFDNQMLQNMSGFSGSLPDHPVGIGDSWTKKIQQGGDIAVTSTLKERRNGRAVVAFSATIHLEIDPAKTAKETAAKEPAPGAAPNPAPPVLPTMKMTSQMMVQGTVEIDEATGMTVASRYRTMGLNHTSIAGGGMPAPMEWPSYISGLTTLGIEGEKITVEDDND